jgi:hypothetical protein
MSDFVLRMGHLLHFHPFAPASFRRKKISVAQAPRGVPEPPASRRPDDLASLSLSVEPVPVDPRVELGRRALLREDGSTTAADDSLWDNPWLWLP